MQSNNIQLRVFKPNDTEAVIALWQAAGLTRPWNDPRKDIARKLQVQSELFLVAVDNRDGEICGSVMAGYDGHRGWINYMAVSPAKQGQQVGRLLLEAAREQLLERGCCKINLQVRADNEQALGFYRALGFSDEPVVSMGLRLVED